MWRKSRQPEVQPASNTVVSAAPVSIKSQDDDMVISDLKNENKVLRDELTNLYNQIAWLSSNNLVNNNTIDSSNGSTTSSSLSEQSPANEALVNTPSLVTAHMTLTRDVGTMIDPNIFMVEALELNQDSERPEEESTNNAHPGHIQPTSSSLLTSALETSNLKTYESRYYHQKLLNQTLDQRIYYLEEKSQQLEEKMVQFNTLKLENLTLKLQQKEWINHQRQLQVQIEKSEKLLYQAKYEHRRDQEALEEKDLQISSLQQVKSQLEQEVAEFETRFALLSRENVQLLEEMKSLRTQKLQLEDRCQALLGQHNYLEMKTDSQGKEILRLQLQLEVIQNKLLSTMSQATIVLNPLPSPLERIVPPLLEEEEDHYYHYHYQQQQENDKYSEKELLGGGRGVSLTPTSNNNRNRAKEEAIAPHNNDPSSSVVYRLGQVKSSPTRRSLFLPPPTHADQTLPKLLLSGCLCSPVNE